MKRVGPGELAPSVGWPDDKLDNDSHFDSIFCVSSLVKTHNIDKLLESS